jgi:gluconate 5-dehydrogenase
MKVGTETKLVRVKDLFDLSGKTALVTGGAGWLGRTISECLAELGAHVFIGSRDENATRNTAEEILKDFPNANVNGCQLDVLESESVNACVNQISKQTGGLDILINNAHFGKGQKLENATEEELFSALDVGLAGYSRCIQAAIPSMKNRKGGSIINIASMYGVVSPDPRLYEGNDFFNPPFYGATKAAILQMTRYAAVHLASYPIRVNAISPGPFPNPTVQSDEEFTRRLVEKTPLHRIGQPWEIKGAIAFLASDASSYVTGHNLMIDGGWTTW